MWHYGPGIYPVIKGYSWVPADPPPVGMRESSAPAKAAEPLRVQLREFAPVTAAVKAPAKPTPTKPKPKASPRSVAPSQQALGFLRAEIEWLKREPIEHTIFFALNESGDVIGCNRVQGDAKGCDLDIPRVVREAVHQHAVSTIVLHQHPHRQCAEPSPADDACTALLREALAAESIGLFDHFVISPSGHVHSYREATMTPESPYERREAKESRLWACYGGHRPF